MADEMTTVSFRLSKARREAFVAAWGDMSARLRYLVERDLRERERKRGGKLGSDAPIPADPD